MIMGEQIVMSLPPVGKRYNLWVVTPDDKDRQQQSIEECVLLSYLNKSISTWNYRMQDGASVEFENHICLNGWFQVIVKFKSEGTAKFLVCVAFIDDGSFVDSKRAILLYRMFGNGQTVTGLIGETMPYLIPGVKEETSTLVD